MIAGQGLAIESCERPHQPIEPEAAKVKSHEESDMVHAVNHRGDHWSPLLFR